jgi:hypothetical protein
MSESIIENLHDPVNLEFVMNGPIFKDGLPLPLTIKSLEAIQGIVDRSYLVLANKQKMSAQERSLFYLQSQGINRGSLITYLGLVFSAAQPVLPIISNLGPTGVWEYAKDAYEFLKLVYGEKKKGSPVTITQSGDGSTVNVNTGTQTITFNGPVYQIANSSLQHYEFLSHQLDPTKVTDIKLGTLGNKEIYLDLPDKTLFDLPSKIGEDTHAMQCEIYEFDKYVGTGRVKVFPDQTIPSGEYRFSVVGNQNIADYIEAMLQKAVKLKFLEETIEHPLRGSVITSLQVTSVEN